MLRELAKSLRYRDPTEYLTAAAIVGGGIARLPIPGRRSWWVVSDPGLYRQVLTGYSAEAFDKGGPIYATIRQPVGAHAIFTTNDPGEWRRIRGLMNPSFTREGLRGAVESSVELWGARMDTWNTALPIPLATELRALNLEVLLRHLFGSGARLHRLIELTQPVFGTMADRVFLPLWLPAAREYRRATAALHAEVARLLAERWEQGPGEDLLWRMYTAEPPLSAEQIHDQVVILLLGGYESSSSAMAWACLYLAADPGLRNDLYWEVAEVCGTEPPRVEQLPRLEFTAAVLTETLRLHPSFPAFFRNVAAATQLGEFELRPGDQIFLVPHALGRNPRAWQDPETFDPTRFRASLSAGQRATWQPFGSGKRSCIGKDMALMIGTLVLAQTLQRFEDWARPPGAPAIPPGRYIMTRGPRDDALLVLRPRVKAPTG